MIPQENSNGDSSPPVNAEEVHEVLARITNSKYFVHAPKKKKFLHLICDYYLSGRAGELNEHLIGLEVFDRDDSYNPGSDPIVRVGAHDVRKKLELYYQNEGANDKVRLVIPVGSYEPVFTRLASETPEKSATSEASFPSETAGAARRAGRVLRLVMGVVTSLLVVVVAWLVWQNRELRRRTQGVKEGEAVYGPVWEAFLKDSDPPLIVLSNPLVYRFVNETDPEVVVGRSVSLTPEHFNAMAQALAPKEAFITSNTQSPRITPSLGMYTGMGEAMGLHRLTDLFRAAGRGVMVKQSRMVSAADLKYRNVILLGSVYVNEWSGLLAASDDFVYTGQATIENRDPQPGEEREYRREFDKTGNLLVDYALVTVKPNISGGNAVMILAGISSEGTEAAAEFMTARNHLAEMTERLRQVGGEAGLPRSYQALLKVGVENGVPTTISLIALHDLDSTPR